MIEVSVTTNGALLNQVEQMLVESGAQSVTLCDAANNPVLEPLPGATPLWPQVIVTGLFGGDFEIEMLKRALKSLVDESALKVANIEQRDWAQVCLDDLKALRFGRHLRIYPSHQAPDATAVDIKLDPGLAFGTGHHATTALCLEWLDANPPVGAELIDYGCGSGILAIAAIKLGAHRVQAVDTDPQALLATGDNAARNDIDPDQLVACCPKGLSETPADILLANILAHPLIDLAEDFARRLKPGGRIVLSGVLIHQRAELIAAYTPRFDVTQTRDKDGWALVEGTKR